MIRNRPSPEAWLSGTGPCIHPFGIEVEDPEASVRVLQAGRCEILSRPGEVPV